MERLFQRIAAIGSFSRQLAWIDKAGQQHSLEIVCHLCSNYSSLAELGGYCKSGSSSNCLSCLW